MEVNEPKLSMVPEGDIITTHPNFPYEDTCSRVRVQGEDEIHLIFGGQYHTIPSDEVYRNLFYTY